MGSHINKVTTQMRRRSLIHTPSVR
jgi:hypothetical protein